MRRRTIWIGLALIALIALIGVWRSRWRLGSTALSIADPAVRSWLSDEVHRLSDSVYLVAASPLQVLPAAHRITIDTITLATDPVANARRTPRLPTITLRFRHCVVDGIDLASMAAGHGLHAARAGCDSMWLSVGVPPHAATASPDSAGFLTLRGNLDLPRGVPDFAVDSIVFPHVQLALSSTTRDGRPMVIGLDHLAMQLDSMRYDPHEPVSHRRPFASRNARITLDHLDERHGHISHFGVAHLAADLSQGTLAADSVVFEPLSARFADSLGFTALRLARLDAAGVDWRAFLTTGDIRIGTAELDTATVSITPASLGAPGKAPGTIERAFATLERQVQVDSMRLTSLAVVERGRRTPDTAVTAVRSLVISHLAVDNTPASWSAAQPMGPVHLVVDGMLRTAGWNRVSAAHLAVDAAAGTVTADSVFAGPAGDDSTFKLHTPWRRDRRAVSASHLAVTGLDVPALVLHGSYAARRADAVGFAADILADFTLDTAPVPHPVHRPPSHFLDGIGAVIHFDTVTLAGRVTFRQRGRDAARAGVLAFDGMHATIVNLSNAPTGPAGWPLHIVADAKMMGAGLLHVMLDLPQETASVDGRWSGTLGPMRATALNEFLEGAEGMTFTDGEAETTSFDARITGGLALGTLAPRWRNLKIGMPGIARDDHSVVGSLKRGVAAIAANLFVLRGTNDSTTSGGAANGVIDHHWVATETLPEFLWLTLREPLLGILKRGSGSH